MEFHDKYAKNPEKGSITAIAGDALIDSPDNTIMICCVRVSAVATAESADDGTLLHEEVAAVVNDAWFADQTGAAKQQLLLAALRRIVHELEEKTQRGGARGEPSKN